MQHFGNMYQVCGDEKPITLSELCSHNREYFPSHTNLNLNEELDVAGEAKEERYASEI